MIVICKYLVNVGNMKCDHKKRMITFKVITLSVFYWSNNEKWMIFSEKHSKAALTGKKGKKVLLFFWIELKDLSVKLLAFFCFNVNKREILLMNMKGPRSRNRRLEGKIHFYKKAEPFYNFINYFLLTIKLCSFLERLW